MIDSSLLLLLPPGCMKRRVEQTSALQSEPAAKMIDSLANGVASWSRCCYLYTINVQIMTPVGSLSALASFHVPRPCLEHFFSVEVGGKFEERPRPNPRPMILSCEGEGEENDELIQ